MMKIYDETKTFEIKNPDTSKNKLVYNFDGNEEYLLCVPYTEKELMEIRSSQIKERLSQLSQDFVQVFAGAKLDDIEDRKREFSELHNELRLILGKTPRTYL